MIHPPSGAAKQIQPAPRPEASPCERDVEREARE